LTRWFDRDFDGDPDTDPDFGMRRKRIGIWLLFLLHRLAAALQRAGSRLGHDDLRITLLTDVHLAQLVCHAVPFLLTKTHATAIIHPQPPFLLHQSGSLSGSGSLS
jgi:hypothetical protein